VCVCVWCKLTTHEWVGVGVCKKIFKSTYFLINHFF